MRYWFIVVLALLLHRCVGTRGIHPSTFRSKYFCSNLKYNGRWHYYLIAHLEKDSTLLVRRIANKRWRNDWEQLIPIYVKNTDTIRYFAEPEDSTTPVVVANSNDLVYSKHGLSCENCSREDLWYFLNMLVLEEYAKNLRAFADSALSGEDIEAIEGWQCAVATLLQNPPCTYEASLVEILTNKYRSSLYSGMCNDLPKRTNQWVAATGEFSAKQQVISLLHQTERHDLVTQVTQKNAGYNIHKLYCENKRSICIDIFKKDTSETTRFSMESFLFTGYYEDLEIRDVKHHTAMHISSLASSAAAFREQHACSHY